MIILLQFIQIIKRRQWAVIFSMLFHVVLCSQADSQHITISSGTTVKSGSSQIITNGNVTNNGTIEGGSGTINMTGNWSNTATFTPSTGTVVFSGTAAQSITKSGGETFYNLTVNKSADSLTLANDVTVNGTLTLTNGNIILGSNILTLGTSSSIGGTPSSSSMIVTNGTGTLTKNYAANGSFTFPVGDQINAVKKYSPVTLNFSGGSYSSASASVRVKREKHPNNSSTTHYLTRNWTVVSSGITGFSCDVTFNYVVADVVGTESSLYGGKWNGSSWSLLNQADAVNHKLTGTVTGFSDFTGGEQAVLPVEMTSFSERLRGDKVFLTWITATEVNNYGFEIERSKKMDGDAWTKIGFVEGHGTSQIQRVYQYTDVLTVELLRAEKIFYRLRQIDRDGKLTYSNVVHISLTLPKTFSLEQNYPNPFTTSTVIGYRLQASGFVRLEVFDLLGRKIATLVDEENYVGEQEVKFEADKLNAGMYFYRLSTDNLVQVKKMLLTRRE